MLKIVRPVSYDIKNTNNSVYRWLFSRKKHQYNQSPKPATKSSKDARVWVDTKFIPHLHKKPQQWRKRDHNADYITNWEFLTCNWYLHFLDQQENQTLRELKLLFFPCLLTLEKPEIINPWSDPISLQTRGVLCKTSDRGVPLRHHTITMITWFYYCM